MLKSLRVLFTQILIYENLDRLRIVNRQLLWI